MPFLNAPSREGKPLRDMYARAILSRETKGPGTPRAILDIGCRCKKQGVTLPNGDRDYISIEQSCKHIAGHLVHAMVVAGWTRQDIQLMVETSPALAVLCWSPEGDLMDRFIEGSAPIRSFVGREQDASRRSGRFVFYPGMMIAILDVIEANPHEGLAGLRRILPYSHGVVDSYLKEAEAKGYLKVIKGSGVRNVYRVVARPKLRRRRKRVAEAVLAPPPVEPTQDEARVLAPEEPLSATEIAFLFRLNAPFIPPPPELGD